MSKILDLARDFERKSKQQASDTERRLKSEFERHEKFIAEALRSSEQKISGGITVHSRRMSALVLKTWLWVGLTVFLVLTASTGVIWWQGKQINENWQTIGQQKATSEQLEAETWGIRFHESENGRFIVIPKDYSVTMGWTLNGGEYELIKLEAK